MGTTIPQLLDEMADARIRSRSELGWLLRHLKEDLTPGKQGKGGQATTIDAAKLLVAALGDCPASQISEEAKRIGQSKTAGAIEVYAPEEEQTNIFSNYRKIVAPAGLTFLECLAHLIDAYRDPRGADKAALDRVQTIGLCSASNDRWPWIDVRWPDNYSHPLTRIISNNDRAGMTGSHRYVFGDHAGYCTASTGLVREIRLDARVLYRVAVKLGLKWN